MTCWALLPEQGEDESLARFHLELAQHVLVWGTLGVFRGKRQVTVHGISQLLVHVLVCSVCVCVCVCVFVSLLGPPFLFSMHCLDLFFFFAEGQISATQELEHCLEAMAFIPAAT